MTTLGGQMIDDGFEIGDEPCWRQFLLCTRARFARRDDAAICRLHSATQSGVTRRRLAPMCGDQAARVERMAAARGTRRLAAARCLPAV